MGINFQDLPPEVRERIRAESALVGKQRQRVTAWKDIPPSWTQHRACGWAGTGECPFCSEPVGPCLYCGDEREGEQHGESIKDRERLA